MSRLRQLKNGSKLSPSTTIHTKVNLTRCNIDSMRPTSLTRRVVYRLNDLIGGRISDSQVPFISSAFKKIVSGEYETQEFNMYIPKAALGIQDDPTKEFLKKKSADQIFWDIGAHIGFLSLYVADEAEYVRAFEPELRNFRLLEQNVNDNFSNIGTHQIAISDNAGKDELHRESEGGQRHSLVDGVELTAESYIVDTQTIDNLIELYETPDLIKIDIEGAELKALSGAQQCMAEHDVDFFIEVHSPETERGRVNKLGQCNADIESLFVQITRFGYDIYGYTKGGLRRIHINDNSMPVYWYATKDEIQM